MPKVSEATDHRSLAVLLAQLEVQPAVAATKALVRAAFLLTTAPGRPFHVLGLNVPQMDVLATLAKAQGIGLNCSEIAGATLITKGGITGILDRLEIRGLVQRIPSRDDRRSIRVQLSGKGVDLCCRLFPELARDDHEIYAKVMRPEQIKQLSKLLTLLVRALEEDSPKTRARASESINGEQRA